MNSESNTQETPGPMMSEHTFWKIISMFHWNKKNSDEILEPAIKYLSSLKSIHIARFQETLAYKLYMLDTREHAKNLGAHSYREGLYFSVDWFLYVRCYVVARGQAFYNEVLNNPKKMPEDSEFEEMLYMANAAYKRRKHKDLNRETLLDYETYSNQDGWSGNSNSENTESENVELENAQDLFLKATVLLENTSKSKEDSMQAWRLVAKSATKDFLPAKELLGLVK